MLWNTELLVTRQFLSIDELFNHNLKLRLFKIKIITLYYNIITSIVWKNKISL